MIASEATFSPENQVSMSIKEEIRGYIAREGKTAKEVHQALQEKYGITTSYQNFNQKLVNKSLRYDEAHQIADVLGYDINWIKRKDP